MTPNILLEILFFKILYNHHLNLSPQSLLEIVKGGYIFSLLLMRQQGQIIKCFAQLGYSDS